MARSRDTDVLHRGEGAPDGATPLGRPNSGADAGHRRHPWPCAWLLETGWRVRPRRRDRAPWAGGGPDVGRGGRPETDAHRGISGR